MIRALAAALGLVVATPALPAEPDVAERVVAVVRGPGAPQPRVITLTRLEDEARIALVSRGAVAAAQAPLDDAALRAGLEWLIDQTLLGDDVARLQVFDVDDRDVAEELGRFRARFPTPAAYVAFLERWELTPEDVGAVLRRMLRVQRYVESRAGRALSVPEADVDAWLAAQPSEDRGQDSAAVRAAVRARLAQERLEGQVKALVADLRRRADVRLAAAFAPAGQGGLR